MKRPFDATGTIGGLPCEVSLNKILAEKGDPYLINKLTRLLQKTKRCLKELELLPNRRTTSYFSKLLRKDVERNLSEITGSPVRKVPVTDIVASHTMCCLHAYFNEFMQRNST